MKKLKPVEKDEEGNIPYNLHATAADVDWMQAGRLRRRAEAGDKAAAKELEEMENTLAYYRNVAANKKER